MSRKLYAVAIFAVKLDPEQTLTDVRDYGFSAKSVSARRNRESFQYGLSDNGWLGTRKLGRRSA